MAEYSINKGVGRSPEFKGLTSQYLFLFAGGLLSLFIIFVVMYMAGVNTAFCIGFGAAAGTTLVVATFRLNARYGPYGMMKKAATARHPRRIISRKNIVKLFNHK